MNDIQFWKKWNKQYKNLYLFLLSIFLLSIVFFIVSWSLGFDAIVNWITIPAYDTVFTPIDSFIHNLIHYSIDINTFLIKERFASSGVAIYPISSYIYFLFVISGLLFFITLITYLDIFWYGLGMAVFLFFLATLKTELIGVFGRENKTFLVLLFIPYLSFSYYFHSFNKSFSFLQKIIAFALLTLLAGIAIYFFSTADAPFLYLANFSIPVPVILSGIFLLIIGFDIVFGFLYITTSGKNINPKGRLVNFTIITALYLLNLILLLLKKLSLIDWDILYINPFIIYLLSVITGIWAYRYRAKQQEKAINFYPHGAYLYVALAIITTSTMAFAFLTGNDPMVKMFEFAILYSHIALGFAFFIYTLLNFLKLFNTNISVYKIAFQPRRVPFLTVQTLGIIIILGLFMYSHKKVYHLYRAGFYNLGGDVYNYQDDNLMAKEYYQNAWGHAYLNFRSNYTLGSLFLKENNPKQAQEYFATALLKNTRPEAYIQLSNLYLDGNMFFPAMFTLQDATKKFPNNPQINSNLGLLFERTNSLDSAYIFLKKAEDAAKDKKDFATNLLSFLIQKGITKEADSLSATFNFPKDIAFQSNILVAKNILGRPYKNNFLPGAISDSTLESATFPYLYNFGLKKLREKEDTLYETIKQIAQKPENSNFRDHLLLLYALQEWYTGDKKEAIHELDMLKNSNSITAPYFSKILGMLLFKQEAYAQATVYLKQAHKDTDQEALLYLAISLLETGQQKQALAILNDLSKSELKDINLIAHNLLLFYGKQAKKELPNWDDALKYQFMHFRETSLSEQELLDIYKQIQNNNIHLLAAAGLMKYYLNQGALSKAEAIYATNPITSNTTNYFIGEMNLQYLKLLLAKQQWTLLKKTLKNIYLNDYAKTQLPFFKAKVEEAAGNKTLAEKSYQIALNKNPFQETVFTNAATFFLNVGDKDKAYKILVNGLELQPNNVSLLKAYIIVALNLNLQAIAEDGLNALKDLIPKEAFNKFKEKYQAALQKTIQENTF